MAGSVTLFFVSFGLAIGAIHLYLQRRKHLPPGSRPLPGPTGLPYIGRVHDIPEKGAWIKFYEWSKTHGPIYQTTMFGSVHVWISSEQIAHDLLSKRAAIYSDRPTIPNLPDNRTSGDYLALLGRTETWKRQRKLCNHLMHTSARDNLHAYPALERDRFLFNMWREPTKYREWVEQFTSRTVSRLCWGSAHPAEMLRHTTFGLLMTISPSGALPNRLSFLRHVPEMISPWKQKEKARHGLEEKLFRENMGFVKDMMEGEKAGPSFVRTFLDSQKMKGGEEEGMRVVGLMAIAGALTIGSPIQSYILAMCHYPEWQTRLQEEIDTVLEDGRCPQWEDRDKLPMLRAVVKEVIRWRPAVPTGIPHAVEEDDVYKGYFIPKGATIHALEWAITRDETTYPDAETFNPSRWLDPSYPTYRGPLSIYPNLNGFSQFGFGRRTCQGIPIVEQDLFLSMGGMAWAFTIRKKRDPLSGEEIPVHWNDFTPLLIAKPSPFEFDALPRSKGKMACLNVMYEETREREEQEEHEAAGYGFARFPPAAHSQPSQQKPQEGDSVSDYVSVSQSVSVSESEPGESKQKQDQEQEQEQEQEMARTTATTTNSSTVSGSDRSSSPEPEPGLSMSYRDSSSEDEELESLGSLGDSLSISTSLHDMDIHVLGGELTRGKGKDTQEPVSITALDVDVDVPGAWRGS